MVIQQSMVRISSLYHASAATPPAYHGDFVNTHGICHQLLGGSTTLRSNNLRKLILFETTV
jgi:hypothetical protein